MAKVRGPRSESSVTTTTTTAPGLVGRTCLRLLGRGRDKWTQPAVSRCSRTNKWSTLTTSNSYGPTRSRFGNTTGVTRLRSVDTACSLSMDVTRCHRLRHGVVCFWPKTDLRSGSIAVLRNTFPLPLDCRAVSLSGCQSCSQFPRPGNYPVIGHTAPSDRPLRATCNTGCRRPHVV
jgi:hypothetical protein